MAKMENAVKRYILNLSAEDRDGWKAGLARRNNSAQKLIKRALC